MLTLIGEEKLHEAIRKELDNCFSPTIQVKVENQPITCFNDLLTRCLITMIQSRASHRGECVHYLKLVTYLKQVLLEPTLTFGATDLLNNLLEIKPKSSKTNAELQAEIIQLQVQLEKYKNITNLISQQVGDDKNFTAPEKIIINIQEILSTIKDI